MNFVLKYSPVDQAWAPSGRSWRKQQEGLAFSCTSKGFLCGIGAKVGNFMVALSYGKTLNWQYLKWFIDREFVHIIMRLWKRGTKTIYARQWSQSKLGVSSHCLEAIGSKVSAPSSEKWWLSFCWEYFPHCKDGMYTRHFRSFHCHNLHTALIYKTVESITNRIELLIKTTEVYNVLKNIFSIRTGNTLCHMIMQHG